MSHDDLEEVLDRIAADAKAAEFYRSRHAAALIPLRKALHTLKRRYPDWQTSDHKDAKLARRLAEMCGKPDSGPEPWLSLQDGAKYARCTKPDGRPRNSYYTAIRKHLGPRQQVQPSELDRLRKDGHL